MTEIHDRVIDASVAGAIIYQEDRKGEALALIIGAALYAPSLLPYELLSIARTKSVREPGEADNIALALSSASNDLDITLVDIDFSETLRLSLRTGLSTYDAGYLYVSLLLDAPLVTFDNRLQRAYEDLN